MFLTYVIIYIIVINIIIIVRNFIAIFLIFFLSWTWEHFKRTSQFFCLHENYISVLRILSHIYCLFHFFYLLIYGWLWTVWQEEHAVENLAPHGNRKRKQPYRRLLPSTQDKLKQCTESLKNPKEVLDEIYSSSGDVYWPRGPRDIYKVRAAAKKVFKSSTGNGSFKKQDEVWVILEKAKKEEVEFSELKFIRNFMVHPSSSVVLL